MAFADHFSSRSADYARFRPHYPAPLFNVLAGLPRHHRLAWDCATGNGQAAHGLQLHFRRVITTDGSLAQLAQALHWFDIERFWEEVRRVLAPGGVVAAWCLEMARIEPAVDRLVDRFYRDVVGPYWPPERLHVETGYRYRDLPFPFRRLPALSSHRVTAFAVETVWGDHHRLRPVVWPLRLLAGGLP